MDEAIVKKEEKKNIIFSRAFSLLVRGPVLREECSKSTWEMIIENQGRIMKYLEPFEATIQISDEDRTFGHEYAIVFSYSNQPIFSNPILLPSFETIVISYSNQPDFLMLFFLSAFETIVISYSNQPEWLPLPFPARFETIVISYSNQPSKSFCMAAP